MDWNKVTKVLHLNSDDVARIEAAKARDRRRKGCLTILIGVPLLILFLVNQDEVEDFAEKQSERSAAEESSEAIKTDEKEAITVPNSPPAKKQNLTEIPPSEIGKLLPIIEGDWLQTSSALYPEQETVRAVPKKLTFSDAGELFVDGFGNNNARIQPPDLLFFAPEASPASGNFKQFGILLPDDSVLIWRDISTMIFQDSDDEHVVSFSRESDLKSFF
ncbi:MAG: hypothetical protein CMO55_23195 [Verrucomicrobiales bacterium]|nr:hypothetical protein [Verrucomicrobiales bacterium]